MPEPPTEMPASAQVLSAGWTGDGGGQCSGFSSIEEPQQYAVPEAGQVIFAEFSAAPRTSTARCFSTAPRC